MEYCNESTQHITVLSTVVYIIKRIGGDNKCMLNYGLYQCLWFFDTCYILQTAPIYISRHHRVLCWDLKCLEVESSHVAPCFYQVSTASVLITRRGTRGNFFKGLRFLRITYYMYTSILSQDPARWRTRHGISPGPAIRHDLQCVTFVTSGYVVCGC